MREVRNSQRGHAQQANCRLDIFKNDIKLPIHITSRKTEPEIEKRGGEDICNYPAAF